MNLTDLKVNKIEKELKDVKAGVVPVDSITDEQLKSTGIKKTVADQAAQLDNMVSH